MPDIESGSRAAPEASERQEASQERAPESRKPPETAEALDAYAEAMSALIEEATTEAKARADAQFESAATRVGVDLETASKVAGEQGITTERAVDAAALDAAVGDATAAITHERGAQAEPSAAKADTSEHAVMVESRETDADLEEVKHFDPEAVVQKWADALRADPNVTFHDLYGAQLDRMRAATDRRRQALEVELQINPARSRIAREYPGDDEVKQELLRAGTQEGEDPRELRDALVVRVSPRLQNEFSSAAGAGEGGLKKFIPLLPPDIHELIPGLAGYKKLNGEVVPVDQERLAKVS
ncbi:MAG: hypothetical protein V1723_00470, partial [Candidatus Uhrbacteria bacterium]